MTKREIKGMPSNRLIVELLYASHNLVRNYKTYKCDIEEYNKIADELIKRNVLTSEDVAEVLKYYTY